MILKYLREKDLQNLVVVSPDVGGLKMSHAYAKALGAGLAIVAKHRVSATEVEALNLIGEVEGRDAILVDDLTETAGTLKAAAEMLEKKGAKKIYAGVSHAVLSDMGRKRLSESAIVELIATDSTPPRFWGECHRSQRGGIARRRDQADPRRRVRDFSL